MFVSLFLFAAVTMLFVAGIGTLLAVGQVLIDHVDTVPSIPDTLRSTGFDVSDAELIALHPSSGRIVVIGAPDRRPSVPRCRCGTAYRNISEIVLTDGVSAIRPLFRFCQSCRTMIRTFAETATDPTSVRSDEMPFDAWVTTLSTTPARHHEAFGP